MRWDSRPLLNQYGVAVLSVAAATGFRILLTPWLGNHFPFATLFLAVLITSWFGGFGPGIGATALGVVTSALFLLPETSSFEIPGQQEQGGLALFIGVGLGIAALGGRMRDARLHANEEANVAIRQRELTRITLASIGDGVLTTDVDRKVTFLNGVAEKLTGWSDNDALGKSVEEVFRIVNEQTGKTVENPLEKVLSRGTIVGPANHTILISRNGDRRPIDDSGAPIKDGEGRMVGAVLVFRDISKRRQADESQRRLAAIVESSDDAIIGKDREGMITSWNAGAERTYGYAADEMIGKPFSILVPASRADEVEVNARRLQAGERLDHYETVRQRRDGALIDVSVSYSPIQDEQGSLVGTAVITRDITQQKRAEEVMRAWDRQLQLITDIAPVLIAHCDHFQRFKFVNRAYAGRFGLQPSEIVGKTISEVLGTKAFETIAPYVKQVLEGESVEFETEIPYRDLGTLHMLCAYQPEFGGDGRVVGYVAAITNITERKRAERAFHEEARATETLYRISRTLWTELDLQKIVQTVTNATTSLTGAQLGTFIYNSPNQPSERYTRFALSEVPNGAFANFPEPRNTAIFKRIFRGSDVVRLDDMTQDIRFGENDPFRDLPEVHGPIRSYLAVPVVARSDEVIGGLFFGHERAGVFTERHESLVLGVAAQAAVAMDNARLYSQLRDSEERFRLLTDALPALIAYVDRERRFSLVNKQYEDWFGQPRDEIQGRTLQAILGNSAYNTVISDVERALAGQPVTYEKSIPYEKAGTRFIRANYVPHVVAGKVHGFFGLESDITEIKRAEHDSRFLADASAALAGLVDQQSTMQKLARLAVPHFADWCSVDMLGEDGNLRRVAVAHVDPSKVELAKEIHRRFPPEQSVSQGAWKIVRTGESEIVSDITEEMLAEAVPNEELLATLRVLGLRSYMGVPLRSRDRVIGVLTFIAAESGRRYDGSDLAVAEDLANRASVAVENARLYHEVREADRRKEEFLAIVGHELRNPLAPISNALQILKLPNTSPQVVERAREMMERQVQHMVRLVDDLLDVSRIVRGKIDLRREPVDIATIISRAVEISMPLIESEGHKLTIDIPESSVRIVGDPVRLSQAVGNLLNNAARYTERGGVITVSARQVREQAIISVRDTGIGIASEELSRIWEMFVQADRRMKGAHGGMGVGLALVKGLVELHGGTVEAISEGAGRGSLFTIRLPAVSLEAIRGSHDVKRGEPTIAVPKRVLIVDDNVDAAESLAMLLRLGGHVVYVAYDGLSALKLAESEAPELAFFDIGMPGIDGYELARRFRKDSSLRRVKLIALTGWGQEADRRRTKEAGFDRHEVKPVAHEVLEKLLAGTI